MRRYARHILIVLAAVTVCGGCQNLFTPDATARAHVDSLCQEALAWRYRNVDTLAVKAVQAWSEAQATGYHDGCAEAMLCMAAERFQQMDFDSTLAIAAAVHAMTDNQVLRLHADIMQMRVAQRTSASLDFFLHRHQATQRVQRILEEADLLSPHLAHLFAVAQGDLHITASTYFYYVDQRERAIDEIRAAEPFCQLPSDTAQWLSYCYMKGSGGLSEYADGSDVARDEFDYLFKAYTLSKNHGYVFFEANTLQSLATLFADSTRLDVVRAYKPDAVDYLCGIFGTDSTAQAMAQRALSLFRCYDDVYQMACALRTLGELAFDAGCYADAVGCYAQALDCVNFHHRCYYASASVLHAASDADLLRPYVADAPPVSVERRWMSADSVKTVPEWIAGIRQQLSVAYSAMGMKAESDYNRNIYVDLLDVTREDAEVYSRALMLQRAKAQVRQSLFGVVLFAVVVIVFGLLMRRLWWRRVSRRVAAMQAQRQQMEAEMQQRQQQLADELERLSEEHQVLMQRLQRDKAANVERHAKVQLVVGIVPFIDRIRHEVRVMQKQGGVLPSRLTYISELVEHIEHLNTLLAEWVQMQQGELSLHITSFPLQPLLDSLRQNAYVYGLKQLTLDVSSTPLSVKADRALTLFMLNTLADNARKFTPAGGSISVYADEGEDAGGRYVELSVRDTGCGLSPADVATILDNKVYDASSIGTASAGVMPAAAKVHSGGAPDGKGSGFGLMNCKGIIEKYRKTSSLFSVCTFGIESKMGVGSRFFFRLPRALTMAMLTLLAGAVQASAAQPSALADSIAMCNASGRYAEAVSLGGRMLREIHPQLQLLDTASGDASFATDIALWQQGADIDYAALIAVRNEVARAALVLHQWPLYRYNNRIFTRLYKLTNQDKSLEAYCQQTQSAEESERVAMVLIVFLLMVSCVLAYFLYLRPQIALQKATAEHRRRDYDRWRDAQEAEHARALDALDADADEQHRRQYEDARLHVQNQILDNCLSTIKHETIYFPARIERLVRQLQAAPAGSQSAGVLHTLSQTVAYYSSLVTILTQQALQQSPSVHFRRSAVTSASLMALAAEAGYVASDAAPALTLRADADLLALLLRSVARGERALSEAAQKPMPVLALTLSADAAFCRMEIHASGLPLTDAEADALFTPREGGFHFLVCRQIVREHDTFFGHAGCRAEAFPAAGGHTILFTFPLKHK